MSRDECREPRGTWAKERDRDKKRNGGGRWRGTLRRGVLGADLVRAGHTGWAEGRGYRKGHWSSGEVGGWLVAQGGFREGEWVGACVGGAGGMG